MGRYSWKFVVGLCCLVLQLVLTLFQTKNCFHTRYQTWPLKSIPFFRPGVARNYVIITYIRTPTKKRPISNSHITLSFLFIWNWNDKYVFMPLPNSLENHTRIQTKIGKVYSPFRPKRCKNHTLWCGTYPLGKYKGVYFPGVGGWEKRREKPCTGKISASRLLETSRSWFFTHLGSRNYYTTIRQ